MPGVICLSDVDAPNSIQIKRTRRSSDILTEVDLEAQHVVANRQPRPDAGKTGHGAGFPNPAEPKPTNEEEGKIIIGRGFLRANITDPVKMWEYHLQPTEIEQTFKELGSGAG